MKRIAYVLFFVSLGLLILAFLASNFYSNQYLDKKTFYASANFTYNHLGFDVGNSSLNFGYVPLGSSSTRKVIYHNDYDLPVIVEIKTKGGIADFLVFERFIEVESKEEKVISFTIIASAEASEGFYEGFIDFIIKPAQ